jgi:hypothetical protein
MWAFRPHGRREPPGSGGCTPLVARALAKRAPDSRLTGASWSEALRWLETEAWSAYRTARCVTVAPTSANEFLCR